MAITKDKSDNTLGWQVHEHLKNLGLETPFDAAWVRDGRGSTVDPSVPQDTLEELFHDVLVTMGMDMTDDSLIDTPKRVAKMFLNEIFYGLDYNNFPKATVVQNKIHYDEMVQERDITVKSTCEHHLLPIIGLAHIAYIPNETVLGLSKLNRIVDFFSRRPQIQERLTAQIHAALCFILDTDDVAVTIEAEHMCVKTRGVEDACSDTVTSKLSGRFRNATTRQEFVAWATAPRRN